VITPGFYNMVRWQSFRRVIEQPYAFYQNDFAGRIATKVTQAGEAVGDFITSILQTMWSFLTFVFLTFSILVSLDPLMGVVIGLWFAGYMAIVRFLLPKMRRASHENRRPALHLQRPACRPASPTSRAVKLFDSGRREHTYVREGLQNFLNALWRLSVR
jgi:ATP-binding cassette subfamily B protein/ATP-binding cassette subfamily B multidrug efflux pump